MGQRGAKPLLGLGLFQNWVRLGWVLGWDFVNKKCSLNHNAKFPPQPSGLINCRETTYLYLYRFKVEMCVLLIGELKSLKLNIRPK